MRFSFLDVVLTNSDIFLFRLSFAGSDTTAIAIRSILYHILRTPSIYDKLVSEIDQADEKGLLSRPYIRYKEAMQLPYLVACCKEGTRMHPSVALSLPRYVPPGGRVIAGRYFPEGAKVGVNAAVIHFDTAIFGSDAALYNPDRWMSKNNEAVAEMDRSMFQFGAGSRTCIGRNVCFSLALLVAFTLPSNLYDIHLILCNADLACRNLQVDSTAPSFISISSGQA